MMATAATYFVLRVSVGLVALIAAVGKLRQWDRFVVGVRSYRIVPGRLEAPIAAAVVAAELLIAALLVSDLGVVGGMAAAFVFAAFATALAVNLVRGNNAPCHCFGATDDERISVMTLARALLLAAAGVFVAFEASREPIVPLSVSDVVPALTIALGVVIVVRLSSLVPSGWRSLRSQSPSGLRPTQRLTYAYLPARYILMDPSAGTPVQQHVPLLDPTQRDERWVPK